MKTSTWGFQSIKNEAPQLCFHLEQNPLIVLTRERFIKMAKPSLSSHVFQARTRPNMYQLKSRKRFYEKVMFKSEGASRNDKIISIIPRWLK